MIIINKKNRKKTSNNIDELSSFLKGIQNNLGEDRDYLEKNKESYNKLRNFMIDCLAQDNYSKDLLRILHNIPCLNIKDLPSKLKKYLKDPDENVRHFTVASILKQLNYDNDCFDEDAFNSVLSTLFYDKSQSLRSDTLILFPKESYRWLAKKEIIAHLISLIYDLPSMRINVIELLGEIRVIHPLLVLPYLKQTLFNYIYAFNNDDTNSSFIEEYAPSFNYLLLAASPLIPTYSRIIISTVLHLLSHKSKNKEYLVNIIHSVRDLCKEAGHYFEGHIKQLADHFVDLLTQNCPLHIVQELVGTLYILFKTSNNVMQEVDLEKLFLSLLKNAVHFKDTNLNISTLRLMGYVGSLKTVIIDNSGDTMTLDIVSDKGFYFWLFTCKLLISCFSNNLFIDHHNMILNALIKILPENNTDEIYESFMSVFLEYLRRYNGEKYLLELKLLCKKAPRISFIYANKITDVLMSIKEVEKKETIKMVIEILPIIVNQSKENASCQVSKIISFLLQHCNSDDLNISLTAIESIISIKYLSSEQMFIIVPNFLSMLNKNKISNKKKSLIIHSLVHFCSIGKVAFEYSTQFLKVAYSYFDSKDKTVSEKSIFLLSTICQILGEKNVLAFSPEAVKEKLKRYKPTNLEQTKKIEEAQSIEFNTKDFKKEEFLNYINKNKFSEDFIIKTIECSPYNCIYYCLELAKKSTRFSYSLFKAALLSCWLQMDEDLKSKTTCFLVSAFDIKQLPSGIDTVLCRLFEYMEQAGVKFDAETCRKVSSYCLSSWHLSKAIYFSHRTIYRSKQKNDEDYNALVSLSVTLNLDKTVHGLLSMSNNVNTSTSSLQILEKWEEARKIYEAQEQPAKFEGIIECLKNERNYTEMVTHKNESLFEQYFKNSKSSVATSFARAHFELNNNDKLNYYLQFVPDTSIKGIILKALCESRKDKSKALNFVNSGFEILASRLNSKDSFYSIFVKAQQLIEVEEIIGDNVNISLWNDRTSRCFRSSKELEDINIVRLEYYSESEKALHIRTYLKNLLEEGKLNIFYNTLNCKYPDKDNCPLPIKISYCEGIFANGDHARAIQEMENLIKNAKNEHNVELLARMNYSCGNWRLRQLLNIDNIELAIKYINKAISYTPSYYRSWHRLSWAYSMKYEKSEDPNDAKLAIDGFIKCVELRGGESFSDLVQAFSLYFYVTSKNSNTNMFVQCEENIKKLPHKALLSIYPQIFARIPYSKNDSLNFLISLVRMLLPIHYHALIYPVMFLNNELLNDNEQSNTNEPWLKMIKDVYSDFSKKSPIALAEASVISESLKRASYAVIEYWKDCLIKSIRLLEGKYNKSKAFNLKEEFKEAAHFGAPSRDTETMKLYRQRFHSFYNLLCKKEDYNTESFIKSLKSEYNMIRREIFAANTLKISVIAPRLYNLRNTTIAVPGTYEIDKKIVRIARFENDIKVFKSKQRPRMIIINGDDGSRNRSLLKGHEDLRLDQRIMQFFNLINQHIKDRWKNSNLHVFRYQITPLTKKLGLIQFVDGADTLSSLVSEFRRENNRDIYQERTVIAENIKSSIDNLMPIQRLEFLIDTDAQTQENKNDLREILWLKSRTSLEWVSTHIMFAQSTALMSIIGYIIGLGDRHPSNIMIHRYTGSVIHIDFSDCFDIARSRVHYPEYIPFRLTRMMISAFGPTGYEGDFRLICENTVRLIRTHRDSIMAVLVPRNYEGNLTTKPITSIDMTAEDTVDEKEGDIWSFHGTQNHLIGQALADIKYLRKKLAEKLAGEDFDDTKLGIKEHVDRLIIEARDTYNLSRLYQGWTPLW